MIASLHKKLASLSLCVSALALTLYAAPVLAQEAEEQETQAQEVENSEDQAEQAAPQVEETQESTTQRRERYYLGERPRMLRQQGPALGKPKSILPSPFVPKGSVTLPPAPDVQVADSLETPIEGAEEAVTQSEDDVAADVIDVEGIDAAEVDGDAEQQPVMREQFLEAGALELLDPSGVAVISSEAAYPTTFWDGKSRTEVAAGYGAFSRTAGSKTLSSIAKKIALSGAALPEPENDEDILDIIRARLSLLVSLGDYEGYIALLERLPAERDWSALVMDFTNKHLLKGELNDACAVAEIQRVSDDDAYWLRLAAFCEAARGNRNGVDFQLGILEEVSEVQPTFYQLIDQIVVEASQAPGTVIPEAPTLSNSLQVDLLEATMARLARARVPLLALDGVNPLAIRMMLSIPSVERDAKIDLMGLALRQGWLDGDTLAAFARNHQLVPGEMEEALESLVDDGRFVIDAALARLSSQDDGSTMRADALGKLWERSVRQRVSSVASSGYLQITSDIVPNPDAGPATAILSRAALISGDAQQAANWFNALRAESAGEAGVDQALISLAPLVSIAGAEGAPEMTDAHLQQWWQAQQEREDRFARANLLFTIMEALGISVSDASWQWLEAGPPVLGGQAPSAALWRRFMIAVAEKDQPKALSLAFALMSDRGPSTVSAALAGSMLGGLVDLGLETEARMIAVEMLIGQGL